MLYPNTVPPFFPRGGLVALVPTAEEYRLRLAGLRAHNRWLAEWCAQLPGRRAGVGQILLNDVDEAVADVHWIADHGLFGGVLLPGVPPGSGIDPLNSPVYDPVWRACEERGVVLNVHGGSGSPDQGWFPSSLTLFVLEASFYSHRPLWLLVLSGVFDRFPGLKLVFAEAGSSWVSNTLEAMDTIQAKQESGNIGVMPILQPFRLQKKPSEYWHSNCWVGASFMTRGDAEHRDAIGVDRIMWGSDFPHEEGTFPHTARRWPTRSPASTLTRSRRWSAPTRPTCTGSTSTRCGPSPNGSGPRSPRWRRASRRSRRRPASRSDRARRPSPERYDASAV